MVGTRISHMLRGQSFAEMIHTAKGPRLLFFYFVIGGLYALCFAPFGIFPLGFLVFGACLLFLDARRSLKETFLVGWGFGLGQFLAGLYWIGISFTQRGDVPLVLGPVSVLFLAAGLALFPAVAFMLSRLVWRSGVGRYFIFSSIWVLMELLRSVLLTGLPWNLTAHMWTGILPMMQWVAWVGVHGLSLFTVLVMSTGACLLTGRFGQGIKPFVFGLLVLILLVGLGSVRLFMNPVVLRNGMDVGVVQAAIPQTEKWAPEMRQRNLQRHLSLSVESEAEIIIWPETAVPYQLTNLPELRAGIMENLSADFLLTGVVHIEEIGNQAHYYNSMVLLDKKGTLLDRADKVHLVPFGEYLPLSGFLTSLGLGPLVEGAGDFSAGKRVKTITAEAIPPFATLICYEVIFPDNLAGNKGAEWILNITNDAWFGDSTGPYQHFTAVRFKAIETGKPVVRAAGTGISAIIDPVGRVLKKLDIGEEGVLEGILPASLTASPYAHGKTMWIGVILLLVAFLAGLLLYRRVKV